MNLFRSSLVLLIACAFLGFAHSARAATFVVDRTDDTAAPSAQACTAAANDCSLRGAIIAANAANSADTITLPAGTYPLTIGGTFEDHAATGDLDINSSLTINGGGAKSTIIDGGGLDRIFHVWTNDSDPGFPLTVTINDLTVTGGIGPTGGGIKIHGGTVALNRLVVRDNQADYGGGVSAHSYSPDVTINRSTITGNEATYQGGGVYLTSGLGSMTIVNSTLIANGSGERGGALYAPEIGSFITLNNDTVTANTAGTSGGGIANDTEVEMSNSLLAGNTSTTGNGPNCDGFIVSEGYNLISDATNCSGVTNGTKHDHVGDDPKLDPLGLKNNGGPTRTIALLAGSPAINAGDDASCKPLDQRGLPRPQGTHCDIGAYEKGVCGDGFLEPEEQCDDHNTNDGDGCSGTCVDEVPGAVCGNGNLEADEDCDDGNTTNGDGCSSACVTEGTDGDTGSTTGGGTTGSSGGGSGGCSLLGDGLPKMGTAKTMP